MEQKRKLAVGIDVGTSSVKVIIGEKDSDGKLVILGVGEERNSGGMRKGNLADATKVLSTLDKAIHKAEVTAKVHIDSAVANINGDHIASVSRPGIISVDANSHPITEADIMRAREAATLGELPANREILTVATRQWAVDDITGISDPFGMLGTRLAVDAYLITALTPMVNNLTEIFEKENVVLNSQFVVSGVAAAQLALTDSQCENGVALLDIGAATINVAVYENGDLIHTVVLPFGSNHITNDLATVLAIDWETAEMIKIKYAYAIQGSRAKMAPMIKIEVDGQPMGIDIRKVDAIVESRVVEMLEIINEELRKIGKAGKLPNGIVLTGGGAKLTGMAQIAREVLRLNAKIYVPEGLGGIASDVADSRFTTAVGLAILDSNTKRTNNLRQQKKSKKTKSKFFSFGKK